MGRSSPSSVWNANTQYNYYKMLQRRGDKVPAQASLLVVPESEKAPLLEGIYRTRLKQQPPAEWKDLSRDERTAKLKDGVIKFWSTSDVLLRQLGQDRASTIKDYLVDKGQLKTTGCTSLMPTWARLKKTAGSSRPCTWMPNNP